MAQRHKLPYMPIYVQDIMTDDKLNECSAATQGIYFKIMCLMHKSANYGKILLKQNYKQGTDFCLCLARQLVKRLTFECEEIYNALKELTREDVCQIEGDFLVQKRMVKDNLLSEIRAKAGQQGGKRSQSKNKKFASDFAKAKNKANTENEIDFEIDFENVNSSFEEGAGETVTESGFFVDKLEKDIALTETQAGATIEFLAYNGFKSVSRVQVHDFWQSFKILHFNRHQWYNSFEDLLMHFRNSFKSDLIKNSNKNQYGNKSNSNQQHEQLNSVYAEIKTVVENEIDNRNFGKPEDLSKKIEMPFESSFFRDAWEDWKNYRAAEHKFFYNSGKSEQAALNELSKVACRDENKAIRIIQKSIASGWKGFFEERLNIDVIKRVPAGAVSGTGGY